MNKSILLIILILFLYNKITSQVNIIPNGSFEYYYSCPTSVGQIDSIIGWRLPSYGTSDYFNICTTNPDIMIPLNTFGNEFPIDGDAYIGFGLLGDGVNYREYIQTKFTTPTEIGHIYKISIFTSLADNFSYAIKQIHMVLSEFPIVQNDFQTINIEPTIIFEDSNYFTNKNGWTKYDLFYLADKKYSYLTIGNFYDDSYTDILNLNDGSVYLQSYYFIDSISMIDFGEFKPANVFTPNADGINDSIDFHWLKNSNYQVLIYNRWGEIVQVLSSNKTYWNGQLSDTGIKASNGIYYYVICNSKKESIKNGFIHMFD
ncbi:MAG: gliding motility-associated C-terminal domain-containing protein [Flavobacteriales bacterium]|nr:gliding motility-associated C-terminal domain-containing protein [Flavobacteriales bacterium]